MDYINPTNCTKEEWLIQNGVAITMAEARNYFKDCDGSVAVLPVCLVDNGHFTAAGVAKDQFELDRWFGPNDYRPRRFYMVPVEALNEEAGLPGFIERYKGAK